MGSWCWIASACSAAALILGGCQRAAPLPVLGTVPSFTLTAQDGSTFDSAVLADKVWVADFIFTNCTGPCPRMTSQMRRLQKAFEGNGGLKLVSISVDPARDTPVALASYAEKFHADHAQWTFLTGPVPTIHKLSRNVFLLGDVDGKNMEHSTRFMLVDRRARIRGSYVMAASESMPKLMGDIRVLLEEKD
jgi:protein SCO1/2